MCGGRGPMCNETLLSKSPEALRHLRNMQVDAQPSGIAELKKYSGKARLE